MIPINDNSQSTPETTPVSNWFSDSWNKIKGFFSGNSNNPNTQVPTGTGTGTGGKKNKSMHKKSKHRKSKKGGRK
jgi:hypothetical protein